VQSKKIAFAFSLLTFNLIIMSSIIVKAGPNDSSDSVIRKFQKRVLMDKVVQEYRDMMFHKKNSEKRKERLAERARKIRRAKRLASA
jgi:ribosomal protein S21